MSEQPTERQPLTAQAIAEIIGQIMAEAISEADKPLSAPICLPGIVQQRQDFGEPRPTGQTAFKMRAEGQPVPAEVPDHAMLYATGYEMKVDGDKSSGTTLHTSWTFHNPQWVWNALPSASAAPIPVDHATQTPRQAKDISDRAVLEFLAKHQGRWSAWGQGHSMPTVADAMPARTPLKLQLAKMRQLMKRGFSGGCDCGCRGDFEITDKGLAYIGQVRTKAYTGTQMALDSSRERQ